MYGPVQRKLPFGSKRLLRGALYGTGASAMSSAMLVPMSLYEPPWRYPAKTTSAGPIIDASGSSSEPTSPP